MFVQVLPVGVTRTTLSQFGNSFSTDFGSSLVMRTFLFGVERWTPKSKSGSRSSVVAVRSGDIV